MKLVRLLLLTPLLLTSLACSTQWRDADDGLEAEDVLFEVDSMLSDTQLAGKGDSSLFRELYLSETSSIYFGLSDLRTGETPLGPPWSLLSLTDLSILDAPELGALDMERVKIALVDDVPSGQAALAISYSEFGASTANLKTRFFAATVTPYVENEELVIVFGDNLVLKTWDVDDNEELMPAVQFRVYSYDSAGNEIFIGKISTLVGYGA